MKRMKKSFVIFLSISMSLLLLLVGCGNNDSSSSSGDKSVTIKFSWWTNPTRTKQTKEAIKLFEKKYPNIHVTMEYTSWDSYWQKLSTEAAGGGAPDVMQMDGSRLNEYASKNQLMDLSKTKVDTSGLDKNTVALGKLNGKLYALTTALNAQIFIYNPEILKNAGVDFPTGNYTWDDLAKLCETIYKKTGVYGMPDEMEQTAFLDYFARTKNENLYSSDGKSLGMSKKTLTEWFQYWLDLQEKGGVPTAQESAAYNHNDHPSSPFVKAKTAFAWLFLGTGGEFEQDLGKPIIRGLLPEWGNDNKPYPLHPAMYWAMSSKTQHADAAAKLINFLENDPKVSQLFQNDRGIPANTANMKKNAETTKDATVKKQDDIMEKIEKVATPVKLDPPGAGSMGDTLKNISQQVQNKRLTPSKAADEFMQQANQALSQG